MSEYFNILFLETYKILFLLVPVLVSVAMIVWLDRRIWAFVQKRRGPNVVGPFGLFQSLADALKYVFKEIIVPASSNKIIFVLDPMLATGNSSSAAIDLIKNKGVKMRDIKLVSLLAAPEGIKNFNKKQKGLHIFTCSLDKSLNKNKFIVPGLGDAGDRYMGT